MDNAIEMVRACIVLHNYFLSKNDQRYSPPGFADSEDGFGNFGPDDWRQFVQGNVCDLTADESVRSSSLSVRETLKDYFFEEGSVDFQWHMTD